MEVFSLLVEKGTFGGFLLGYFVEGRSGKAVQVTHMLFVDHNLVFYNVFEDQLMYPSWILLCFEALSRLKVNLDRSVILPVGNVENVDRLAHELECKAWALPSIIQAFRLGLSAMR